MKNILVIDDDLYICNLLTNFLEQKGHKVEGTTSGLSGIQLIEKGNFDVVLCDFRLPDSDGLKILEFTKQKKPDTAVIIMTAYTDVKMAVKLIKSGAFDYVTKPIQPEEITQLITKATAKKDTGKQQKQTSFSNGFITGKSKEIQTVLDHIKVVAPTEISILIEGETGSGKEYIARAIHNQSNRRKEKFIAVDCGAIPKELANSELFGHIKGSFTGAIQDKKGYFEQAKGGTLFLDEIGNLPYENQVKLLRALQEQIINRVGDTKNIKVDVRLIAAANDNLWQKIQNNEFREDLYHRLNGFKLNVPPLRERKDDIMEFTWHFIQNANKEFSKSVTKIEDSAKELMTSYQWDGNIRELQNIIKRAVLLANSDTITQDVFPDEIKYFSKNLQKRMNTDNSLSHDLKEVTELTEKELISDALVKSNYNKSKAAKILNIDRKTLYNKIKLYDI